MRRHYKRWRVITFVRYTEDDGDDDEDEYEEDKYDSIAYGIGNGQEGGREGGGDVKVARTTTMTTKTSERLIRDDQQQTYSKTYRSFLEDI